MSTLPTGLVVAAHGRHCLVEADDGSRRICHPRGKKSQAVVGDRVRWLAPPPGQGDEGSIEAVEPRRNLLYRQDEIRTKSFAANIDQVLVLIAAEPEPSEQQLARVLIAAEAERIVASEAPRFPESTELSVLQARGELRRGQTDRAIQRLSGLTGRSDADAALAFSWLAVAELTRKRPAHAIGAAKRALALDRDSHVPRHALEAALRELAAANDPAGAAPVR